MGTPLADKETGTTVTKHSHHDTYDAISPRHLDLAGKAVFITGASRSIGRAIAVAYAQAGVAFLALSARGSMDGTIEAVKKAAAEANKPAPTLLPLKIDTADQASVDAAVQAVAAALKGKPLDILVNNAGALEPITPIDKSDPVDWWNTFEVNVKGLYLACRAVLPLLLATAADGTVGNRTIVNLTSIGGILLLPGMSGYNTSKLAVCRLTEFLALEYADEKLVTFAVHPGGVVSDMSINLPRPMHATLVDTPELASESIVYLTRVPQLWLSGRYVSVEWDMPELEARKEEIAAKDLLKNKLVC